MSVRNSGSSSPSTAVGGAGNLQSVLPEVPMRYGSIIAKYLGVSANSRQDSESILAIVFRSVCDAMLKELHEHGAFESDANKIACVHAIERLSEEYPLRPGSVEMEMIKSLRRRLVGLEANHRLDLFSNTGSQNEMVLPLSRMKDAFLSAHSAATAAAAAAAAAARTAGGPGSLGEIRPPSVNSKGQASQPVVVIASRPPDFRNGSSLSFPTLVLLNSDQNHLDADAKGRGPSSRVPSWNGLEYPVSDGGGRSLQAVNEERFEEPERVVSTNSRRYGSRANC